MKKILQPLSEVNIDRVIIPFIVVIFPGNILHGYIEYLTTGISPYFFTDVGNIMVVFILLLLYRLSIINNKELIVSSLYSVIICIQSKFVIGYFDSNFNLETNFLEYQIVIAILLFALGTMVRLIHLLVANIVNIVLIIFCMVSASNEAMFWRFVFCAILVSGGGFVAYAGQTFIRGLYEKVKEARAANEKQNVELKRMNGAKDQLFRIIGHDLRTPFHQLNLLVDLMAQSEDEEQIDEYRKLIRESAVKGTGLLEDLMHWSQNIGQMEVKLEESSVSAIVDKTFDFFKFNCGVKDISLINDLPKDLKLKISDSMMETVFRNLVGNAIKFSHPKSKIVVNSKSRGNFIDIFVQDEGIGISEEGIQMLLAEGRSVSTEGTNNEKGTGYGVSIVKKLVERQKGLFSIASQLEKGTTITLSFPKVA